MCNSSNSAGVINGAYNDQARLQGYYQEAAVSASKKTLAQQLDQRIADLQKQISNIERMKRQLAAGAALDTDISTLREALG